MKGQHVPSTNRLNNGVQLTKNRRCANLVCLNQGVHPTPVCRKCAVRFEPIRANSLLFHYLGKVLPCGLSWR